MKLSSVFLLVATMQIMATGYAQNISIDLNVNGTPMRELFKEIERQTELSFIFSDDVASLNNEVSINVKNRNINDVLNQLFINTNLYYQILNEKLIVVAPKQILQQITVTGKITDANDEPLPGVSIHIRGTSQGTVSDAGGAYSLTVPDENVTLVFSFLGFTTQEMTVGAQRNINITLSEDASEIEEVVVVGYATQKKVSLTGAVSQVSGKDITSKSTTSVVTALQGMMPGVNVLRTTGQPGSENDGLRVRGFSSVNEVSALILIDGMEGSLTYLNHDDIESISVLKDAASASIYGARAAGGVVLVTTRKGAAQKLTVNYNGSFGINIPGMMPKRMAPWEEQDMIQQANLIGNGNKEQSWDQVEWIGNPNYLWDLHGGNANRYNLQIGNTNWLHEGTREYTTTQRHAVNVSGGHGKTTYYFSGGYYTQNGLLKYGPDSNDRYNLRATVNTEMNDYLEFKLNTSYEANENYRNSQSHNTIMSWLYNSRGRASIYLPESDYMYNVNPYNADINQNPIAAMKTAGNNTEENRFITANASLRIKNLVKGLTLDLNASRRFGSYSRQQNNIFVEAWGRNGQLRGANTIGSTNDVIKVKNDSKQDKLEALLNYRFDVDKHSFALLGGASYEQYLRDQIEATARNLFSESVFSFKYYDATVATNSVLTDEVRPWKIASLFGRFNYSFDSRYLFEFVARYDGSSRLAPGNRFGFFPGVSGGWIVSEESFFEPVKEYASFMKLRASYGQVGNSTVLGSMYYPYIGTIYRDTQVMGQTVYYQRNMASADVTWETVTSTNVAVDLAFLKNKLTLTAEYYWKKNKDMLSPMDPGNIVGAENLPSENIGTMKTWGWELSAGWRDKIGDVRYNVSFNLDDSKNKLVEYKGTNTISAGTVSRLEGYALNTMWGYKTDGFWGSRQEYLDYQAANPGYQSWESAKIDAGDVRYVSQGVADHTIGVGGGTPEEPGDLIHLGDANGRCFFGVNLGVQWKGFDFSCFFQGVGKRSFFINNQTVAPLSVSSQMPWTVHRDYWREDNQNAYFARLWANSTSNYQYADRWVQNGAYLRLKNIQLGYTIPITKYIESLRVYVTGTDIWEHTKTLNVFDPEISNRVETATSTGINDRVGRGSYYPFFRTWTAGINLTF